jgi:hypothetical protein
MEVTMIARQKRKDDNLTFALPFKVEIDILDADAKDTILPTLLGEVFKAQDALKVANVEKFKSTESIDFYIKFEGHPELDFGTDAVREANPVCKQLYAKMRLRNRAVDRLRFTAIVKQLFEYASHKVVKQSWNDLISGLQYQARLERSERKTVSVTPVKELAAN